MAIDTEADRTKRAHRRRPNAEPVTRRLAAGDRRKDILARSIDYFARVGFDGGTRELARDLGITQPLLYRYFPNKDALITEIYNAVYLDQWKAAWGELLNDRDRPLRDRLQQFYEEYTDVILNPTWMRIYFFAGLKGVGINERYLALVEERILRPILREFHHEIGATPGAEFADEDIELVWALQGSIFYYGVRKYVLGANTYLAKDQMISNALTVFFEGYAARCKDR